MVNNRLINELFDYILQVSGIRQRGYVATWLSGPLPLNIPTPTPAPDHPLGGHERTWGHRFSWYNKYHTCLSGLVLTE
jgi:hypothetical protein